ncbi:MAG: hypothetical protein HYY46_11890, partial [Deltaproteobacteria bacterium]|nr:hypothetical protein [Deltaproteobacteria bacterium]
KDGFRRLSVDEQVALLTKMLAASPGFELRNPDISSWRQDHRDTLFEKLTVRGQNAAPAQKNGKKSTFTLAEATRIAEEMRAVLRVKYPDADLPAVNDRKTVENPAPAQKNAENGTFSEEIPFTPPDTENAAGLQNATPGGVASGVIRSSGVFSGLQGCSGIQGVSRFLAARFHSPRSPDDLNEIDVGSVAERTADEIVERLDAREIKPNRVLFLYAKRLKAVMGSKPGFDLLWRVFKILTVRIGDLPGWEDEDDEEKKWLQFMNAYKDVRFPDGWSVLDVAVDMAQVTQVEPVENLRMKDAILVASIAYALRTLLGDEKALLLPVADLKTRLGKSCQHWSDVLGCLVFAGILDELNGGKWSKKDRRAKEYRFTADSRRYRVVKLPLS